MTMCSGINSVKARRYILGIDVAKRITAFQKKYCDILILMEISGKVNQAKAYKLAGSVSKGKNLIEKASRTARLVQCQQYLTRARARVKRLIERTEAEITAQLEKLAFSELTDYVAWDEKGVKLKPSVDIPKDKIPALKSILIDEKEYTNKKGKKGIIRRVKIDLHNPKGPLDSLARIKGMMKPDLEEVATFAKALHEAMKEEEE